MGWRGPVTHRQFTAWQAWDDAQWNVPTVEHHYLAELRRDVACILMKKEDRAKVKLDPFLCKFERRRRGGAPKVPLQTAAQASASMRLRHASFLGGMSKVKVVYKTRAEIETEERKRGGS